jgi:hypothetical protein
MCKIAVVNDGGAVCGPSAKSAGVTWADMALGTLEFSGPEYAFIWNATATIVDYVSLDLHTVIRLSLWLQGLLLKVPVNSNECIAEARFYT